MRGGDEGSGARSGPALISPATAERSGRSHCGRRTHRDVARVCSFDGGSGLQIGIRIVVKRPFRQQAPEPSQQDSHFVLVEMRELRCLLLEVASDLWLRGDAPADEPVVSNPPEAARRQGAKQVQPSRRRRARALSEALHHRVSKQRAGGHVYDAIVELEPGVVLRLDVRSMAVVEDMEWSRQDAVGALELEVQGGGASERGQEVEGRVGARRQRHEEFRQLEGFRSLVDVETEEEVGLDLGDVAQNHVHVLGHQANLFEPSSLTRRGLFTK